MALFYLAGRATSRYNFRGGAKWLQLDAVPSNQTCLWKFRGGGNFPVDPSLVAGSASKTFRVT